MTNVEIYDSSDFFSTENPSNGFGAGAGEVVTLFNGVKVGRACFARPSVSPKIDVTAPNRYPAKYGGGFDGGIEFGFLGDLSGTWDRNLLKLAEARQAADDGDLNGSFVWFGGVLMRCSSSGIVCGRIKYKFVLEWHGVRFYVHSNPSGTIQPVRVKIGAVPLMKKSLLEIYNKVLEIVSRAGCTIMQESVSRADLQILLYGVRVFEFLEAMQGERIITLCRGKMCVYSDLSSGRVESITIRSRTAELCIYDKFAEVMKTDPAYFSAFIDRYCADTGGLVPEKLTRVELRLRGEALKAFGVRSVAELVERAADICRYMLSDWFRILSRDKVRGHENEIPVCELWAIVQRAFSDVFGGSFAVAAPRRKQKKIIPKLGRLMRTAVGLLSSAVAIKIPQAFKLSSDQVFECFTALLRNYTDSYGQDNVLKHVAQLEVMGYYD